MRTLLQVERECTAVKVGLREVRVQIYQFFLLTGLRACLIRHPEVREANSCWCLRVDPNQTEWKVRRLNVVLREEPGQHREVEKLRRLRVSLLISKWAPGKWLNLVCLFLGWSLPRYTMEEISAFLITITFHHISCPSHPQVTLTDWAAFLSLSATPFLAGSLSNWPYLLFFNFISDTCCFR